MIGKWISMAMNGNWTKERKSGGIWIDEWGGNALMGGFCGELKGWLISFSKIYSICFVRDINYII